MYKKLLFLILLFELNLCIINNKCIPPYCDECPKNGINVVYLNGGGIINYNYILNENNIPIISNVNANLTISDLNKGSETNECVRQYTKFMEEGVKSDAGHMIGNRLGGSGKSCINIFPQNPKINRGVFSQYEKEIYDNIKINIYSHSILNLYFNYLKRNNTRPYQIMYKIKFNDTYEMSKIFMN